MFIRLITPAPAGSRSGNRVTATRWARLLRELGHRVEVAREYRGGSCDVLFALHARKSFDSIRRFRLDHPDGSLIVALTGTDLYGDLRRSRRAGLSLEWATHLIVLQPLGVFRLPSRFRRKAVVVRQSAVKPRGRFSRPGRDFPVCVLGHLREVKDPFRTALACRLLPDSSRIRVIHLGRALSANMAERARREMARNPRYRWKGEVPHAQALRILAGSRLLVLTSRMEGGANVISEALAGGVPVLTSRIPGTVGLLGRGYPGYFQVGNTRRLALLLERCESDPRFYSRLEARCRSLAPLVRPARERDALRRLLRGATP